MSTLKLEHIAHIDNAGPDISIDTNGHLNIVNGNLQMGGVTMLDASNGDLSTGNNASVNIRDAAGEVAGRIRNWSSPTNSIAIESDPLNAAADSYLTFTVDGDRKATIESTGAFNIGTTGTSGGGKLRVNGLIDITATSGGSAFRIYDGVTFRGGLGDGSWTGTGDAGDFGLYVGSTAKKLPIHIGSSTPIAAFTSTGLGVGTTQPDLTLHVDGTNGYPASSGSTPVGHIAIRAKNESSSHGAHIGVANASPWGTWIQAQDAGNLATNYPLLLNPNGGNVGIGTTNPAAKLEISSLYSTTLRLASTRNSNVWTVGDSIGRVEMYSADGTAPTASVRSSIDAVVENTAGNAVGLAFKTYNNTERMRIDTDGNVGIGTTGPEVKLEVNGGADDSVVFGGRSDGGNGNNRRFNLIAYADGGGANYGGGLKIQTRDSVNVFHDRITVQSNGNVGIGADTPENSLHVKNNTATNGQMIIQGDANNTYIRMNKSGSTWSMGIDASDSNSFKIGNNTDLSTGTRLTVTTSGKVLINTTDPQDDPSMLRVLNSMSNLGSMCIGKVHNSTNNNNAAVLLHRLGQSQGHQFSGKFITNSWTGNRHIDCHITSYYTNDAISVNTNFTNSGSIAATTVRLCTVNIGGVLYLAFVKDGGGSGVSYVNAFIEGNIHYEGGVREVLTAGSGFTVTTTHHTF